MKTQGYTDIFARYKGGSTIAWARGEIREREAGSRIIVQTGVNNILNTGQGNGNILFQFKQLVKENRDKTIILTSILPAGNRNGKLIKRIDELNDELKAFAVEEHVTYVDLTDICVQ